ncbi:hypothetical protein GCM10022419_130970 [Nonomuraea rosea]|uniref:Deoxynucleoside kinase domain-containing protein n=1 Tax=Nonomuraea rosea TaxID=638574 RepID=A0ABP7A1C4_9ACTN
MPSETNLTSNFGESLLPLRSVVNFFPIAVEGSIAAGKTTLCRGITSAWDGPVVTIPDYSDCFEQSPLPSADPQGLEEEAQIIDILLDIERRRFASRLSFFDPDVLGLIDRSILTIAAHCAGLDAVYGTNRFEDLAMRMLRTSKVAVWPTHAIYLDLPHRELMGRLGSRARNIFTFREFVDGYRGYFERLNRAGGIEILWLDATNPPKAIVQRALNFVPAPTPG